MVEHNLRFRNNRFGAGCKMQRAAGFLPVAVGQRNAGKKHSAGISCHSNIFVKKKMKAPLKLIKI